jgi:hypothetical protein
MEKKSKDADLTAKKLPGKPFMNGNDPRRNMDGRPEGSISLTSMIKRKLMTMSPDQKRTALEMLAENIIQDALDGKDTPVKLIWNYIDGLPKGESETQVSNTLNQVNIIAGDEILNIAKEVAKKLMLKEVNGDNKPTA